MKKLNQRLQSLEDKLLTPENFTIAEYLNFGNYSVVSHKDRMLILEDFESLNTAEQQMKLSILWAIQPYRTELGFAIHITCGNRTHEHELRKGRSGESVHLWGAIDMTCETESDLLKLSMMLERTWIGGFKHYKNKNFIHADIGENRRW